ncbi:MAG: transglutaminase-like domain-containing protein [Bacillota bacterium]
MHKNRIYRAFVIIVLLSLIFSSIAVGAVTAYTIDTDNVNQGTVTIHYENVNNKKLKVIIQKGEAKYTYNLGKGIGSEVFPLQMGDGAYTVTVLENVNGNQYRAVATKTLTVKMHNSKDVYLQSVQMIKWDKNDQAVQKAKKLTEGIQNDEDKVKVIYEYIVNNYSYDHDKINNLDYDYLPDINSTLESQKGICYDFSALFASMCRSVGIPAKLVKGYGDKIQGYHAWNEVFIESTGKWMILDTSFDSQMRSNNQSFAMFKDNGSYEKVNEY